MSAQPERVSATDRILALMAGHRLSPTQRRIGQFLLDHAHEVAFLSTVDLAARAGVSQPSVTRFAAALGFRGYSDLRRALGRAVVGTAPESATDVRRNELQAAIDDEIANLVALRETLSDPTHVLDLGREFATSSPLVVMGHRLSAPLAEYFAHGARRLHPDVRLVGGESGAVVDGLLQAQLAGARWVLAFAMPRYARATIDALGTARSLGLRTALVTDSRLVSFADRADIVLAAPPGSRLVFDSHSAGMVLAGLLLEALADAAPERTQTRLEEYEHLAERHGFFTAD